MRSSMLWAAISPHSSGCATWTVRGYRYTAHVGGMCTQHVTTARTAGVRRVWCNSTNITTSSYKGCWRWYRAEHMLVVCVHTEHAACTYSRSAWSVVSPNSTTAPTIGLGRCNMILHVRVGGDMSSTARAVRQHAQHAPHHEQLQGLLEMVSC